jgi:hypothetical protein
MVQRSLRRFFSEGFAETRPDAFDPRLRGRTYSIPFEDVWQAALALTGGGVRGCVVMRANDRDGIIIGKATRRIPPGVDDFTVSVILDADGQTRVDARSVARNEGIDLGANARRVIRFFQQLDKLSAEHYRARVGAGTRPVHPGPDTAVAGD